MATKTKTAKIDEDISNIVDKLDINFSGMANDYFKQMFQTVKGINKQIEENKYKNTKLYELRDEIIESKKKMTSDEKAYFIETGELIKRDKKFINPRIKAIYNKFNKIVESEEELKELIEVAKK